MFSISTLGGEERRHVDTGGYESLWWLEYKGAHLYGNGLPAGSYAASGAGVHLVMVIPSRRLVIVNHVDNDPPQKDPKTVIATAEQTIVMTPKMGEILKLILAVQTQLPAESGSGHASWSRISRPASHSKARTGFKCARRDRA